MEDDKTIKETVSYSLEPAFLFSTELIRLIAKAGTDPVNEWFFYDGAFTSTTNLEIGSINTWVNENFVVIQNRTIVAYFEGRWNRPLDIFSNFRVILFDKSKTIVFWNALYDYFDYLFQCRNCQALNWSVALKNGHAYRIYEHFIKHSCGHRVGIRHHAQKSYTGQISDIVLYEITRDEYFAWKKKKTKEIDKYGRSKQYN